MLRSLAAALGALAVATLATGCQPAGLRFEALVARATALLSTDAGPTPAMYQAIREAAAAETHNEVHVSRIDYIGQHDNGAGSIGYMFYIYFSDSSGLKYERFVRVLRTADGSLHVLAA